MNTVTTHNLVVQREWPHLIPVDDTELYKAYTKVMDYLDIKRSEVTLRFSDDLELRALNKAYRQKDKATNVLSFTLEPIAELELELWGDIAISMDTVLNESREQEKEVGDHIVHLFIHGCLHLAGFDHEYDEEAELMELHETKLLDDLGYKNPYLVG